MKMKNLFLLALASVNALYANCNYINESDLKNLCIAETRDNINNCHYIKNIDKKNYCLAIVK